MTDTLWKPTDEPDIIAAEHIIASAHYKSKDWTDVYLVPVAQYHALAARVQELEREREDWQKSAQQFNGTYESLHRQVTRLREASDSIGAQINSRCENGCGSVARELIQQALRETGA